MRAKWDIASIRRLGGWSDFPFWHGIGNSPQMPVDDHRSAGPQVARRSVIYMWPRLEGMGDGHNNADRFRRAADVTAVFWQRYGYAASGVWSAPGRVNLIGEHTDYNDGLCLPIALPQRAWLAAAPRQDDTLRVTSVEMGDTVEVAIDEIARGHPSGWAAYLAGVLWAMRQAGLTVGGLDAVLASDVPIGAGLSSSAAIEGCLAVAASDIFGLGQTGDEVGRAKLASICQQAENEIAGAPTGGMDQTICLRARAGQAALIDFSQRPSTVSFVPFDPDADAMALLVINTNAKHALVDGQYGDRRAACRAAAQAIGVASLRQVEVADLAKTLAGLPDGDLVRVTRHVVTEIARVRLAAQAAQARDWAAFGELMNQSHASLRDDYRVSSPELDAACQVAVQGGAVGARMTGGGFGGSAIALIKADLVPALAVALATRFQAEGWAMPDIFPAQAGAAAG